MLQMILELDTRQCASEHVGLLKEWIVMRAWKPFLNRHVLKTLTGSSKGKAQREQYLLAAGLGVTNGIKARHRR